MPKTFTNLISSNNHCKSCLTYLVLDKVKIMPSDLALDKIIKELIE